MTMEMIQGFELSPQQRHLWSLRQPDAGGIYRSRFTTDVKGDLDPGVLEEAIRDTVERHELLRTNFRLLPGMAQPLQVISEGAQYHYAYHDLSALAPDEKESRRAALLWNELGSGNDDEDEPRLRVIHLALESNRHLLVLDLPSMCADAKGLHLLAEQIRKAYVCRRDGGHMTDPPAQYADIAQTFNECIESDEFDFARSLWRERCAKVPPRNDAPFATSNGVFHPRAIRLPLPDSLTTMAGEFCARSGLSLEGLLLTCWGLLMCRMAATEEMLIGMCCDGRTHEMLRQIVGPLSRHVPFGFSLRHGNSFEDAARAIDALREALTDQQYFFDPSSLGNTSGDGDRDYGACFEHLRLQEHSAGAGPLFALDSLSSVIDRFAIKLMTVEHDGGLYGQLEYNTFAVSESETLLVADCFTTLLGSALANPDRPALALEILPADVKQELFVASKGPEIQSERLCAHELFEQRADERPDSMALAYEDHYLSYGELEKRANRLGQYLRLLGVGPETRVGLCLNPGLEVVVGLLGIMKAGGAYVPLDISHPNERLAGMLEDAQATVLVTERAMLRRVPEQCSAVCIDADWDSIGMCDDVRPPVMTAPENLAYVIYTSGTTGRPKGVGIEQRQLYNYVRGAQERLGLEEGMRMGLVTTVTADLGHTVLYGSLCLGGELHVVSRERSREASLWEEYVQERQVECVKMTPTQAGMLVRGPEGMPEKRLVLGGEELRGEMAERLKGWRGGCRVYNHYGPTECTVGAVAREVERREAEGVAMGRPLANVRAYVMNGGGEAEVMRGSGELYIGGEGVGRGYLNDARQTAERYVPEGYGEEEGRRVYRTGDVVRRERGGELKYERRVDRQVKVRGYRVEPGEVERVMMEVEGVRQCVVELRGEGEDGKRLVAYVEMEEGKEVDKKRMREEAGRRLPEYMVPGQVVVMERLPVTGNGKLDRRGLPEPSAEEAEEGGAEGEEPGTPVEEIIAGIWAEVLRVERVGRQANFFELGGHSLLATQVVSRVREALGVELGLRQLFDRPTVAAMAEEIEQQSELGGRIEGPPVMAVERGVELPLSFAQQRLWFVDRLTPASGLYNLPAALRFTGPLNMAALEDSLSEMIRLHEVLRTTFAEVDGQPVQMIGAPWCMRLPVVDLSRLPAPEQELQTQKVAEEEALRPFDVIRGPHLRGRLMKMAEDDHGVLLTLHHIVADGWSMRLFIRGITTLYEAFSRGEPPCLPETGIQYADFAVWQREWLKGEVLEGQIDYWKQQLGGNLPRLAIKTDRPRPAALSYRGALREIKIGKQSSDNVKALSRREGATLFMTLLAAFYALLYRHTGQEDLVVGTDVANRTRGEIEKLIGFFVNQLVLRVSLSGDPTFQDLLGRVREVALGAYAHQDLPFEKLVEVLKPERSISRAPLFQVKMILQNIPEIESGGAPPIDGRLACKPLVSELARAAQLDLNLIIHDSPQELTCSLKYSTDLFDDATARRLLRDFKTILTWVATRPAIRLSELVAIMEEDDKQELISLRSKAIEIRRRQKSSGPRPIVGVRANEGGL